ncbi:MAG: septum formation initiator family protein [Eubacterium sp.]|nr:septum formation initiator family protein [Eubacterium sp.]
MNKNISKFIKSKSFIKLVIAIFFIGLVSYCSYTLVSNYSDISRLKAQAVELDAQYENQIKENEKIKAILNSDNKEEYIEQKAREKGYVKDGEIVFYDIS